MKENPADIVTQKILERTNKVSERIAIQLKNTKPFATELISPTAKIWALDNVGTLDMMDLRKEFGDEAIGRLIFEIEELRTDKRVVRNRGTI